jgi:hypothetical protein
MLSHLTTNREALLLWHALRAPALALAVALIARFMRINALAMAAAGLGAAAGWAWLVGVPAELPRLLPQRLPALALAAALGAWLADAGPPWLRTALPVLLGAGCGWWLAGAPLHHAALMHAWPNMLGIALAVVALAQLLAGDDAIRAAAAAFALWAALWIVRAPAEPTALALVPLGATVALTPRMAAPAQLASAVIVAGAAATAVLEAGRLARGGFGPVECAALAPLLAAWLPPRLSRIGRAAPGGAAAIAVGTAWIAAKLLALR